MGAFRAANGCFLPMSPSPPLTPSPGGTLFSQEARRSARRSSLAWIPRVFARIRAAPAAGPMPACHGKHTYVQSIHPSTNAIDACSRCPRPLAGVPLSPAVRGSLWATLTLSLGAWPGSLPQWALLLAVRSYGGLSLPATPAQPPPPWPPGHLCLALLQGQGLALRPLAPLQPLRCSASAGACARPAALAASW